MNTSQADVHLVKARSMSDVELRTCLAYNEGSPVRAAADTELARRKFWKTFWSHGIVAWLALAVSFISLIVALKK
jgi:hypothetical protein